MEFIFSLLLINYNILYLLIFIVHYYGEPGYQKPQIFSKTFRADRKSPCNKGVQSNTTLQ